MAEESSVETFVGQVPDGDEGINAATLGHSRLGATAASTAEEPFVGQVPDGDEVLHEVPERPDILAAWSYTIDYSAMRTHDEFSEADPDLVMRFFETSDLDL